MHVSSDVPDIPAEFCCQVPIVFLVCFRFIMEKFILRGYTNKEGNRGASFCLNLPKVKKFFRVVVQNCEAETFPEKLVLRAVNRRKGPISPYEKAHLKPSAIVNGEFLELPKTLQQILAVHPFPISQGPVVLPLDTRTEDKKTVTEVLQAKTIFSHCETQTCGRWTPKVLGTAAWTDTSDEGTYVVTEPDQDIQGVASTRDMSMVFTCQFLKCIIECPCQVCRASRNVCCKSRHCPELCKRCMPQCSLHKLKVPFLFDPATDLFTMITDRITEYRFAYGYAGVPRDCKQCSVDVLEHQVLHLVQHQLCRFCRFESRPLEQFKGSKSFKKFKKAEQKLNLLDNKTCSTCLKECRDMHARKLHEKIVHQKETQKFKCELCSKSYVCQSSLDYHVRTKHGEDQQAEKSCCEDCGKQFSTSSSLARHKMIFHSTEVPPSPKLVCDCGMTFSLEANMRRHKREKHFEIQVNTDYEEGFRTSHIFECENCDQKFKRKDHLRRHVMHVHTEKKLICCYCDQKFVRQDNLKRHIKNKHDSE